MNPTYEQSLLFQVQEAVTDRRKNYWSLARPVARLSRKHSIRWIVDECGMDISEDALALAAKSHHLFHALWLRPHLRRLARELAGQYDPSKWEQVALVWWRRTRAASELYEDAQEALELILLSALQDLYTLLEFSVREAKAYLANKYSTDPIPQDFRRLIQTVRQWRAELLGLIDKKDTPKKAFRSIRSMARKAEEIEHRLEALGKDLGYELQDSQGPF